MDESKAGLENGSLGLSKITKILADQYSIVGTPGKHGQCPACERPDKFWINHDDRFGFCFHVDCKFSLRAHQKKNISEPEAVVQLCLQRIHDDWNAEFLRLRHHPSDIDSAYSYVTGENRTQDGKKCSRGIHPKIADRAMLGVVPKSETKIIEYFTLERESALKEILDEDTKIQLSKYLDEIQTKLIKTISSCSGWLALFYTDADYGITAIELRETFSKEIRLFKPFSAQKGVFGLNLYAAGATDSKDPLVVVEGAFNLLQLHSAQLRFSEATDSPQPLLFAVAVGSVTTVDYPMLNRIEADKIFCTDNDKSGAGNNLLKKALHYMNAKSCTTPRLDNEEKSDLDSLILRLGSDPSVVWQSVKDVFSKTVQHYRHLEALKEEVFKIRRGKCPVFDTNNKVVKLLHVDMKTRCKMYFTKNDQFLFRNDTKDLIKVSDQSEDLVKFLDDFGFNTTENVFNFVVSNFQTLVLKDGIETEVFHYAYYDRDIFTVYLFNQTNQVYKISPEGIQTVDNGTDGVLFRKAHNATSFRLVPKEQVEMKFAELIIDKINFSEDTLTKEDKRILISIWFFSLFFGSILPTRMILALIGQKGSGKSVALRIMGKLLLGEAFEVTPLTKDPRDFDAAVTNTSFVVFDNADIRYDWMEDKLATAATGQKHKMRKYYTNNDLAEYEADCFIGVTSRTPHFKRDDVVERMLPLKLDRLPEFLPQHETHQEIKKCRDQILSEVIYFIQDITKALQAKKNETAKIKFRMADFADFFLKIASYQGWGDKAAEILEKLSDEQNGFSLEGNPIFELLTEWCNSAHAKKEVTSTELCTQLSVIAVRRDIQFDGKGNPSAFAQKLPVLITQLEKSFTFEIIQGKSRQKKFKITPLIWDEKKKDAA